MSFKPVHLLILSTAFLAGSCGYGELPVQKGTKTPAQVQNAAGQEAKKKEIIRYNYRGDKYRDPFVSLTGEGNTFSAVSEEVAVPNLGSLILKGVFDDGVVKMALISGGGVNYVLKGTRLYDNRQRLVRGISGIIKKDSVLMIAPDKTTKEIRLKVK